MAAIDISKGPFFIRSNDSPNYALSVAVDPPAAGSAVVFERVEQGDWNTVRSQWVIEPVTQSIYRIALFASQDSLFLTASAATATSPIQVAAASSATPALELQLWELTLTIDSKTQEVAPQWITSPGANGMELGFTGDTPLAQLPLILTDLHDGHYKGDQFLLVPVNAK